MTHAVALPVMVRDRTTAGFATNIAPSNRARNYGSGQFSVRMEFWERLRELCAACFELALNLVRIGRQQSQTGSGVADDA